MPQQKQTRSTTSTSATNDDTLVGRIIGREGPKNKWRIGKKIGQGACASVHRFSAESSTTSTLGGRKNTRSGVGYGVVAPPTSTNSNQWVIKIAGAPINGEKHVKTHEERQADSVGWEGTLYSTHLAPLSLLGKYIPQVPLIGDKNAPQARGEITTRSTLFTYIVMERMASPLADWASLLNDSKTTAAVAQQMLECIRQLHLLQLVYVDVKLDNFMLTVAPPSTSTMKTTDTTDPAQCLRIINFDLVETLQDATTGKHREDVIKGSPAAGTPIYASCNLMEGHTPSRRDDLEALGYVILHLLLLASQQQLPWAQATSDREILLSKEDATFYSLLSTHNDKVLEDYMKVVKQLQYNEKPDYVQLHKILGRLVAGKAATSAVTGIATRSSTETRTKSSGEEAEDKLRKLPQAAKFELEEKPEKTSRDFDSQTILDLGQLEIAALKAALAKKESDSDQMKSALISKLKAAEEEIEQMKKIRVELEEELNGAKES